MFIYDINQYLSSSGFKQNSSRKYPFLKLIGMAEAGNPSVESLCP